MRQSRNEIRKAIFILIIPALWLFSAPMICQAELTIDQLHRYLSAQAKFDNAEINLFKNGEMIAKLLPAGDKNEVAVCGIIILNAPPEVGLRSFQEVLASQNRTSIVDFGSFSEIPEIGDLKTLTLDKKEIEDLKECRIGNCRLKLSAAMINRFQKEVDWNSPGYAKQVTALYKQLLVEYVRDYLLSGEAALIEYNDKSEAVRLREEHQTLVERLLWVNESAPEFAQYLRDFPRFEISNVRNSIGWTKIKFGLKPVIVITQTITYTTACSDISQVISVSKQIYANHYFDSSMAMTALISFPKSDSNSYLLYTNHSRSSSLDGVFSKVVEKEAMNKLKSLLENTKISAEAALKTQNRNFEKSEQPTIWGRFNDYLRWLPIPLVIALLLWFGRRVVKKYR